jgi:type II secretion system protein N
LKFKPTKKTLLYAAYIIGITIFFLWYLFPSDALKSYLAYRLTQGRPDVTVTIDRVKPVMPPGIDLQHVVVVRQRMTLVNLKSLRIMPELQSLFGSRTAVNFKGSLFEGIVSGRMELGDDSPGNGTTIDGRIAGVQVQQIALLKQLSEHEISGGLDGTFSYADTGPSRSLSGNLNLNNCRIMLAVPVFNQKSFEFKNVAANLTLQGDMLTIKQLDAKGNQLDLNLTGTLGLDAAVAGNDELNLSGTVTPHHVFLAKIEKDIPVNLLRDKKTGKAAISFRINGTMGDPAFSLN